MTASASTRTVPSNLIQITEPTKNALKKAAKKAEKEKKKADVAAKLQEELALRQREETANDFAAENYGSPSSVYTSGLGWIRFNQIAAREDQLSLFRCVVDNARSQSAKLAFLNASQELHSVQMVVAEDREAGVSRPMVKFAAGIPPESVCTVFGVVKRTTEPVKSATVQDFEVHVNKVFVVSRPHMPLPLQPSDSNTPLPANEKVDDSDSHGALVSLNTRLNHRVLDLRATVNHCIFLLKDGVDCLFQDFLRGQGFVRIHTPKIIGAASEGIYLMFGAANDVRRQ
jgi:aspartyl-tRNA synthetase